MHCAKENFVRQGGIIATSMVLVQQTNGICPSAGDYRNAFLKMIVEKGEDTITKVINY